MEKIQVLAQGRHIDVEIYAPKTQGKVPGILYLHELIGLMDCYREDAQELADQGYLVYLPNLYTDGAARYCVRAMVAEAGRKNRSHSGPNLEVHDLLDSLKADSRCNGRLGVIGQCLTGGFVLHMAKRPDVHAPVIYHHSLGMEGSGVPKGESLDEVKLLQGHWARRDPFCPAKRREALIRELGDRVEAHVYDRPHSFRSFKRDSQESKQAWARTLDFFERQLKAA
ncbi:MAG: dienelactone hydrolase family protein [Salinisphaeraceae bacterium]|nr:dienelactone hydrolase family protein [Salinisphaeraceae bacterium]